MFESRSSFTQSPPHRQQRWIRKCWNHMTTHAKDAKNYIGETYIYWKLGSQNIKVEAEKVSARTFTRSRKKNSSTVWYYIEIVGNTVWDIHFYTSGISESQHFIGSDIASMVFSIINLYSRHLLNWLALIDCQFKVFLFVLKKFLDFYF